MGSYSWHKVDLYAGAYLIEISNAPVKDGFLRHS